MALIGLSLAATKVFTSRFDKSDDTDKTKFRLKTLDSRIIAILRDKATTVVVNPSAMDEEVNSQINMNMVHFDACVYGIEGIENFKDGQGNDIDVKTLKRNHGGVSYTVIDPQVVMMLPPEVVQEIGAEVMKANEVTAAEAKN